MRKVLATLSIVLVAAVMPVMAADVTFSGEVDFGLGTNFTDAFNTTAGDSDLVLSATVDDMVSFTIGFDNLFNRDSMKLVDDLYMTIDVMKAFGLDSPIGFSLDAGYRLFRTQKNFINLTGYEENQIGYAQSLSEVQLGGTFTYGNVGLLVAVGPESYYKGKENLLINLYGEFGGLKAEAYYIDSDDAIAKYKDALGGSITYDMMGDSTIKVGVAADYMIDAKNLDLGVAFGGSWNSFSYGLVGTGASLFTTAKYGVGLDLSYRIMDSLKVYGAVNSSDVTKFVDSIGYEAGMQITTLGDQVDFYLGWNDGIAYRTVARAKDAAGNYVGGAYVRIVSKF